MSKRRNAAQAVSFANRHPNITAAVAIILVILITAFAIFCILNPERFKKWLGLDKADGADGLPVGSVVEVAEADLSIHSHKVRQYRGAYRRGFPHGQRGHN